MLEVKEITTDKELIEAKSIRQQVFVEEQGVPLELEVDDKDNLSTTIHVALCKDRVMVATGRILDAGTKHIHLGRIAVLKNYRGLGLGREIILGMEKIACEMTNEKVTSFLSAQLYAEKFYESLGYVRENDEIYLDAGIKHIDMQKRL